MRNLKKILALALALTMILSVTASAAFTDAAKIDADYAEAVDVLNGMNVFKGYEDGSFKPQGDITRAEVAAIIYRIATQDVEDDKVDLFEGTANFSDVPAGEWYAGYVGYCANAGYIKGYPNGTFQPQGKVTGMEALAMILRAMGYDAENEFSGAQWSNNITKIAYQEGILDDIKPGVLSGAASRELVAQLLFSAIQAPTVRYNAIRGYVEDNEDGLGAAFELVRKDTHDDWGRPGYKWEYNTGAEENFYAEAPIAVYTVETDECQFAEDLGEDEEFTMNVYTNGKLKKDVKMDADANYAKEYGAQGTLIEVYEDEIVIIDTYLAKVDDVVAEKTDSRGHITREARCDLIVYNDNVKMADDNIAGNDYAEDDYILVYYNEETEELEAVSLATTFVGAQTKIWWNNSKRTIDGEDYPTAEHFELGEDNYSDNKYNWFLDLYGNVIGCTEIDDLTKYAVLKDIIWNVGRPGYAEATLVFMDETEETVIVNEFDDVLSTKDDVEPELADGKNDAGFPGVSSDSKYNEVYEGYGLYLVTYRADGTVNLDLGDWYETEAGTDAYEFIVKMGNDVTLNTGSRQFLVNGAKYYVNTKTQILVNEGDEYKAYGIDALDAFVFESADIFFTVNTNGIATRIYVKDYASASEFGNYLFVTDDAYARPAGTGKYVMNVLIDGVEREVITSKAVVEFLAANEEKLFYAEWDEDYSGASDDLYGRLTNAYLINEATEKYDHIYGGVDFLYAGDTEIFDADGLTIICAGESYRVNDETVFINGDDIDDVANGATWVISSLGKNGIQYADYVYCGAKLNQSVALDVDAKTGTEAYVKETKTWTVTNAKDVSSDELTYKAADPNAVILYPGDKSATGTAKETVYLDNTSRVVTVWNEAGTDSETYTVTLVWKKATNLDLISHLIDSDNQETVVYNGNGDAYTTLAEAVANVKVLDAGTAKNAQLMLNVNNHTAAAYRNFTTTAGIVAEQINVDIMTTGIIELANAGEFIAVSITVDGAVWYAVFQVPAAQ